MKKGSIAYSHAGGFSIIELSIVMIIIGLIISGGISVFGPSMRQALKNKNEVVVQDAVKALVGYAGAQKLLPTTLSGVARSLLDAQQNALLYAYDNNFIENGNVCNRDATNLSVQVLKADGSVNFTVNNVAFVIWSKGYDGVTAPAKTSEAITAAATYTVPIYSETTGNVQDDLVGWATISELKAAAGCGGNSLKILADALPVGRVGPSLYGAVQFTPEGGVAPYSWCVEFPATTISNNMTFKGITDVTPVNLFGDCAKPTSVYISGNTLALSGNTPFDTNDQGGPYDFIVFLKDSNNTPRIVNRRFSLFVTP
ncbi:hypothetical protein [Candidatus Magnetaquicoccus inordinatus]|uniref:hypothetical protein n=1 Tax=Candidatus Magnetaquicoccus inordinatus TaxID=2496818 RepID=UPI00102CE2C2|nr:hypothetical protein [Candidatus Magnetaquicoccus inordinatus]